MCGIFLLLICAVLLIGLLLIIFSPLIKWHQIDRIGKTNGNLQVVKVRQTKTQKEAYVIQAQTHLLFWTINTYLNIYEYQINNCQIVIYYHHDINKARMFSTEQEAIEEKLQIEKAAEEDKNRNLKWYRVETT